MILKMQIWIGIHKSGPILCRSVLLLSTWGGRELTVSRSAEMVIQQLRTQLEILFDQDSGS